jgi:signal transduction histidine kinase
LLIIAIPVAFQLILLAAIAAQQRIQSQDRIAEVRSKEVTATAARILRRLVDAETGIRGYVLTENEVFTEPYRGAVSQLPGEFQHLHQLTDDSPRRFTAAKLEDFARPVLSYNAQNRALVASGSAGIAVRSIASQKGKRLMDRFRAAMDDFLREQEALDRQGVEASRSSERRALAIVLTGFVVNLILAAGAAHLFARNVVGRIGIVLENTARLERREALRERQRGDDEIATLDHRFHDMAAALDEGRTRLEESNQELEAFTYSVSHDLRAPLRAIDGYAKIIEEDYADRFDAEGRRCLAVVRSEAGRLGMLIDDLLTFSRLGRAGLTANILDMTSLAREVFVEVTTANSAEQTVRLDLGNLPPALADRTLIRQVLTNLISNAVKFSSGREGPVLTIGASNHTAENTYWVRDNGAGFDSRYTHKLFGVFQRLHGEHEFPGTGVGLAIVRRVVQRHGGRVWAESELGSGATFYFTLPAAGSSGKDKGVQG